MLRKTFRPLPLKLAIQSTLSTDGTPPKRRQPAAAAVAPLKERKARLSKLAKDNDITAEQEAEFKEAFHLFAVKHEEFEDEKEGVIPAQDVRRALIALGLPPSDKAELASIMSALDPDTAGYVPYEPFLSICAMKLHNRTEDAVSEEVETAFRLFTRGKDGPITAVHLRRVARELKEEVGDDMLRSMVLEANGGAGVNKGVGLDDFETIMRRANVF